MSKIIFCAWGITQEQQKLLEGIRKYTLTKLDEKKLEDCDVDIVDAKLYESSEFDDPVIVFCNHKLDNVIFKNHQPNYAPPLKELVSGKEKIKKKKEVVEIIERLIDYLLLPEPEPVEEVPPIEAVIEHQGIKVGETTGDILISEQEAIHLKKIKDILGGGKLVITKGDLRIEVGE